MLDYRGDPAWLVSRAFWQGYSKRIMGRIVPETEGNEREYLRRLFIRYVPERVGGLLRRPLLAQAAHLAVIFVFTAAVGLGYVYALANLNLLETTNN